jgi:hypothetical protein
MQISVRLLQLPTFSTPLKVIENPFFYQLRHFTGSIDVPEKSTIMYLRAKFTEHMLSGTCTSFPNLILRYLFPMVCVSLTVRTFVMNGKQTISMLIYKFTF